MRQEASANHLFTYLHWRGDLSFSQAPFCAVDNLIFCCLSYLNWGEPASGLLPEQAISLKDAAAYWLHLPETLRKVRVPQDITLLQSTANSVRFGNVRLFRYVESFQEEQEQQFSATAFLLDADTAYIAFRGTDNTLIGWKEDFNMSFMTTVPAQLDAVEYLERAATAYTGEIYVGGHSKGGNLAVYAAAFCSPETQKRIHTVYNMDGPGFAQEVIEKPGYARICSRIHTYIPQSSVVGMLLEHEEAYTIVHSTQSGLMQHNVYSWEVLRNHLIELETVTKSSRFIDQTLKSWLKEMDPSYRGKIIDTIYELFAQTDARTVSELTSNWYQNVSLLLKSWKKVDPQTQEYLREMMRLLLKAVRENVEIWLPRTDAS